MAHYTRILLLADPSLQRTPALDAAARMAKAAGARLHINVFDASDTIAAMKWMQPDLAQPAMDAYTEVRRAWAVTEAQVLQAQGIDAVGDAAWARPAIDEMLEQIGELKPDLVIKDVHHEPALRRIFLTPLDWQLLRQCPAQLLLVNSAAAVPPRRVLAAIDPVRGGPGGHDFNRKIVQDALGFAIQCDAELHLVTAFDAAVLTGFGAAEAGAVVTTELFETLRDSHRQVFDEVADAYGVPAGRRHFLYGPPAAAIAEFAGQHHTDVIAVGASSRHGVERFLLGSTAESLCENAPCNLLAIKPEGFAAAGA
ncbi:MAG: universal stress protein [Nevskiaceae bacterium]|nr:MAG: universal stress protein [Nevskiaceae bacterium]